MAAVLSERWLGGRLGVFLRLSRLILRGLLSSLQILAGEKTNSGGESWKGRREEAPQSRRYDNKIAGPLVNQFPQRGELTAIDAEWELLDF